MTPCEELGYKVGDRFEILTDEEVFTAESIVELFRDDGSPSPLFKLVSGECDFNNCDGEKGAYASIYSVKPIKKGVNDMTIKTNDKVKFSDAAKHPKSYDADALGVVKGRMAGNLHVVWTLNNGSTFVTNNIGIKNLELMSESLRHLQEEQVTLQPGDWCCDDLTEEQYSQVFDCFVNAGALIDEEKRFQSYLELYNLGWCDDEKSTYHAADTDSYWGDGRKLTYSQIINATNAKPKGSRVKEPEVTESKPAQRLLDAALCELSMLNEQITALTKQRNEVQEYIKQRNAAHGVSVEFGVEVEEKKELNITNWRDLLPGDVIEITKSDGDDHVTVGQDYTVCEVEPKDYLLNRTVQIGVDDYGQCTWLNDDYTTWRFISRPS